jgi:hypothetical protein
MREKMRDFYGLWDFNFSHKRDTGNLILQCFKKCGILRVFFKNAGFLRALGF